MISVLKKKRKTKIKNRKRRKKEKKKRNILTMRRKRRERKEKRNRPIGSIEDKWSNDVARITRVNMEGETALVFTLIGADERGTLDEELVEG